MIRLHRHTLKRSHEFTTFGVNGEVWLSVQNAVHHPRTVSICRVVCICRCDLKNWCTCRKREIIKHWYFVFKEWYECTQRNSVPNILNLMKMYSVHPGFRQVCFFIKTALAWHHLLTNGSSAVNGCRQNECPNSW